MKSHSISSRKGVVFLNYTNADQSDAWADTFNVNPEESGAEVVKLIDKYVQISLSSQWIKCSERMPEGFTEVVCFNHHSEYLIGTLTKISENNFICESCYYKIFHVTHWMPLPEPPTD